MIGLTPDVVDVKVPRHGTLRITFAEGEVEVLSRMRGPVFEHSYWSLVVSGPRGLTT